MYGDIERAALEGTRRHEPEGEDDQKPRVKRTVVKEAILAGKKCLNALCFLVV